MERSSTRVGSGLLLRAPFLPCTYPCASGAAHEKTNHRSAKSLHDTLCEEGYGNIPRDGKNLIIGISFRSVLTMSYVFRVVHRAKPEAIGVVFVRLARSGYM